MEVNCRSGAETMTLSKRSQLSPGSLAFTICHSKAKLPALRGTDLLVKRLRRKIGESSSQADQRFVWKSTSTASRWIWSVVKYCPVKVRETPSSVQMPKLFNV